MESVYNGLRESQFAEIGMVSNCALKAGLRPPGQIAVDALPVLFQPVPVYLGLLQGWLGGAILAECGLQVVLCIGALVVVYGAACEWGLGLHDCAGRGLWA